MELSTKAKLIGKIDETLAAMRKAGDSSTTFTLNLRRNAKETDIVFEEWTFQIIEYSGNSFSTRITVYVQYPRLIYHTIHYPKTTWRSKRELMIFLQREVAKK